MIPLWLLFATSLPAQDTPIADALDSLVATGVIVGAQVAASRDGQALFTHSAGTLAISSEAPVTSDTLFLIASCSKPFASATVLRMLQDPKYGFALTDEIDRWLPEFSEAMLEDGTSVGRAPTIAELLCHRAGIYSQKVKITPQQSRVLYTFDHTLSEGVDRIASQPLLAQPGTRFAYSGAGYCVLGRVAELIDQRDQTFETLLQENVCSPLKLTHTTYFPAGKFDRIATGFAPARAPHKLGDQHRWPLIGGSLYSTAEEMVRFAAGVAGFLQTTGGSAFLDENSWQELETNRNPGQGYSLGWTTLHRNGTPIRFSHNGSLQSYRSFIAFDRHSKTCVASTYTLTSPKNEAEANKTIREALREVLDGE